MQYEAASGALASRGSDVESGGVVASPPCIQISTTVADLTPPVYRSWDSYVLAIEPPSIVGDYEA